MINTIEQFAHTRTAIRDRYVRLLQSMGSRLLDDPPVREQVLAQVDNVVEAAYQTTIGLPHAEDGSDLKLSADIGRRRAASGVHPSQSLLAASLIFEAALPVFAKVLATFGQQDPEITAGLALNRVIMSRMSVAADFYVRYLLERIHNSNHDERRHIARDLHDLIAPTMALGLQSLDLYDAYAINNPARATDKIAQCRSAMHEALAAIRSLAAQTKEGVERNGLEYALRRTLDNSPHELRCSLELRGDETALPPLYAEELFLVVREAIRNAFQHAQAASLKIRIQIDDYQVTASVSDDGIGIGSGPTQRIGLGVGSMQERAELLSGHFELTSSRRGGTTMTVTIPLPPTDGGVGPTLDQMETTQ